MATGDYRGKCFSTNGKTTKTGDPKRSGNFSYQTFRLQQLQSKDYYVRLERYEDGIEQLVVGENKTPLAEVMGIAIEELARTDPYFDTYQQKGFKTVGNKQYEASKTLRKCQVRESWRFDPHAFVYREIIYTDGDFKYNFPNY